MNKKCNSCSKDIKDNPNDLCDDCIEEIDRENDRPL